MKILVIDDDFENRDILKARLEQAGYSVADADNGEDGFSRAQQEEFDLVILDVMMPKKDGWQVCKELRSDPKTSKLPVIMLTAMSQPIDEMRSWESGADEYLSKPVDPALLVETIRKLLSGEALHGAQ